MLCFRVSKNGEKIALAGLRDTGVLSAMLTWAGREQGASAQAAAAGGPIPGLHLHIGGLDSSGPSADRHIYWAEGIELALGDEILISPVSADNPDEPMSEKPSFATQREGEVRRIQCSFCGEWRQTEPKPVIEPGIAGPSAFICVRCLILAEKLLHGSDSELFHLTRSNGTCNFCGTEAAECASAPEARMCRSCVDMIMSESTEEAEPSDRNA
jgi:hypothetical protein